MTPGRNPSIIPSTWGHIRTTTPAACGFLRSSATERRPRADTFCLALPSADGLPPIRSMRMISAPISANNIAQNGPGPMPANSMILNPFSGPIQPPAFNANAAVRPAARTDGVPFPRLSSLVKTHTIRHHTESRAQSVGSHVRSHRSAAQARPYHGWVFNSDGKLVSMNATRGFDADINADGALNLRKVPRLEEYRGFYFTNYNSAAISLVDYLAGAKEYLDSMCDQSEAGLVVLPGEHSYSINANFKYLCENSYDGYHLLPGHVSYLEFLDGCLKAA